MKVRFVKFGLFDPFFPFLSYVDSHSHISATAKGVVEFSVFFAFFTYVVLLSVCFLCIFMFPIIGR